MPSQDLAPYRMMIVVTVPVPYLSAPARLRKVMQRSKRISLICILTLTTGIGVAVWNLQVPLHAQIAPAAVVQFTGEASPPDGTMTLWYRQPASDHPFAPPAGGRGGGPGVTEWVKALPVGNGRLGAMVFGG